MTIKKYNGTNFLVAPRFILSARRSNVLARQRDISSYT